MVDLEDGTIRLSIFLAILAIIASILISRFLRAPRDGAWTVQLCAVKNEKLRSKEGGIKSQQRKVACSSVELQRGGVSGVPYSWLPWRPIMRDCSSTAPRILVFPPAFD